MSNRYTILNVIAQINEGKIAIIGFDSATLNVKNQSSDNETNKSKTNSIF
jgi:hypothetical protein